MTDTEETPPDAGATGQEQGLTRREFLVHTLVGASFVATGVVMLNSVGRYLVPPKQAIQGTTEKVEVATVAELPDGGFKNFAYNGQPCAVINVGGQIRGFTRVCTHLQCAIDWDKNSKAFVCPCHGAVFDPNGRVVSGPAPKPLAQLKLSLENGKVYAGGWQCG